MQTNSHRRKSGLVVCFDAETDSTFCDYKGCEKDEVLLRYMQFTVIVACSITVDELHALSSDESAERALQWHVFWRDECTAGDKTPVDKLLALFDDADVIIGFNSLGFDLPLLRRFYPHATSQNWPHKDRARHRYTSHRCKSLDLMYRVKDALGHCPKLDAILLENGLETKISNGLEAVRMWNNGERDALRQYCQKDVELTFRLAMAPHLRIDGFHVPHSVFGIRSAVAALRDQATGLTLDEKTTSSCE